MGDQTGAGRHSEFNSELPWSSVFDSAANMRALSAIQAEGLRAASELVERFVRFAATGMNNPTYVADPATQNERADLYGATDIAPLIRSWLPMWGLQPSSPPGSGHDSQERSAQSHAGTAGGGAAMNFESSEATGPVKLDVTVPGIATAELWLHNGGMKDFGDVRVGCTGIVADSGLAIEGIAITFDPAVVPIPPRSSRGITVGVDVAHDVVPGVYRGLIVVDGHPQLCVPIVVTIHARVG